MSGDIHRINYAVRTCLRHCYQMECPFAGMAEFCRELRALPGWDEDDVRAVETTVLRMLESIVSPFRGRSDDLG